MQLRRRAPPAPSMCVIRVRPTASKPAVSSVSSSPEAEPSGQGFKIVEHDTGSSSLQRPRSRGRGVTQARGDI